MGKQAECPSCFFEFEVDDKVVAGEVVACPDCAADLEVTAVHDAKVDLEQAEMAEEDWGE